MEINRKMLITVLTQIKAYKDVIVFQDSFENGCLDILYIPKSNSTSMAIHKMVIRVSGPGMDLFDDTPVVKLGRFVPVYLSRIKALLKDTQKCEFENGYINGVCVEINTIDGEVCNISKMIVASYNEYWEELKLLEHQGSKLSMKKIDWAYTISECTKFVSNDSTRLSMTGICFDFGDEEKKVNIVSTDGRKLILLHSINLANNIQSQNQFIINPGVLFVPESDCNTIQLCFYEKFGKMSVTTVDYRFEGLFECIEGSFPNYKRVIPDITESTQWFTLCAASFRTTMDSVRSLLGKNDNIYFNAENPNSLSITISEGSVTLEVEGTASRPMQVSFAWEHISPCLFDGVAFTKFYLDGSYKAIRSQEKKSVKGLTLNVIKLFMPTGCDSVDPNNDEFRIPKNKDISVNSNFKEEN